MKEQFSEREKGILFLKLCLILTLYFIINFQSNDVIDLKVVLLYKFVK